MTIFLYILRDYIKYVLGTVVLTVFLFILFDFIHKTTKYFAEYNPSTELIIKFYLLQVPSQVMQALPIAGLLASVVCMVLLCRTNEITAMRAAGMGPFRIGLPLGAGGLLLSLVSLVLAELVVPDVSQRMHYVQDILIEKKKDQGLGDGARWVRDGLRLISFQDYDQVAQTLTNLRIVEMHPNFRPAQIVDAMYARFDPVKQTWGLQNVKRQIFKRTGVLDSSTLLASETTTLPIEPKRLKKDLRLPNELSYLELNELVARSEKSGVPSTAYKVELQQKLAYPFAAFVVSLIGLKFGYRSERSTETAKGIVLAFIIGISYWVILSAGRALGMRGDLHPIPAAWLANVCILGIAVTDAWRSRRGQ